MKNGKWVVLLISICLAMNTLNVASAWSSSSKKPVKLQFSAWHTAKVPGGPQIQKYLKGLEKVTGGMYKINYSWGSAMGPAKEQFELVRSGIADIAWFAFPYTPGMFPMMEMFELPIHCDSAEVFTQAMIEMIKKGYFDEELKDVKLLAAFNITSYIFYWTKDPVATLGDFKGKKVRSPGGIFTKCLEALGSIPVSLPSGETYLAMQRGIIDGTYQPWVGVPVYKLEEISKYVTETQNLTFTQGVAMNKRTWDRLPKEAKKYLEDSFEPLSLECAQAYQRFVPIGKSIFEKAGGKTFHLSPTEKAKLVKLYKPIWGEWINKRETKGFQAKKALSQFYDIFNKLGVANPFIGYKP